MKDVHRVLWTLSTMSPVIHGDGILMVVNVADPVCGLTAAMSSIIHH